MIELILFAAFKFLFGGKDGRFFQIASSRLEIGVFGMLLQYGAVVAVTMPFLATKKMFVGRCFACLYGPP
jgi:hypothetical protein